MNLVQIAFNKIWKHFIVDKSAPASEKQGLNLFKTGVRVGTKLSPIGLFIPSDKIKPEFNNYQPEQLLTYVEPKPEPHEQQNYFALLYNAEKAHDQMVVHEEKFAEQYEKVLKQIQQQLRLNEYTRDK